MQVKQQVSPQFMKIMYQQTKVGPTTSVSSLATDQLEEILCNLTEKRNPKPQQQSQHEILFRPKSQISTPFKDFFEIVNQEFQRKKKIPAERIRILQSQFKELQKQLDETEEKRIYYYNEKIKLRKKIIKFEDEKSKLLAQGKQESKLNQISLWISDIQDQLKGLQASYKMQQKIFYKIIEQIEQNQNAIKDSDIVLAKLEAKRALFIR